MSGGTNNDNHETLFSFELLVENIRLDKGRKVSDELALGARLLDFPTLLIYQSHQGGDGINQQEQRGKEQQGEYTFNRGKSCFFKMNLSSLHTQLSVSPLYAMVLDVKEEIPRLVGTSLVSLANVMDRITKDVREHGASAPSSHGERGLVGLYDLMEEKIGSISLSYKLLSLGASLLPHITDSKSTILHEEQHVQEGITGGNISTELLPLDCRNVYSPALPKSDVSENITTNKPSNENILINEDKWDKGVAVQTEHKSRNQPQTLKETDSFEDLTIFCPPHLYYSNSAEDKSKSEGGGCRFLNLDSEAFTSEETSSEEETSENKIEGSSSPTMNQKARHGVKTSGNQETSVAAPNVLREALQQLPLLNALLVELSQLNDQNPHQSLSIHPNLAWIYRPASTEPSAGHGVTAQKVQTKPSQKTRQETSPHLKHLHSPRNCSTPVVRPASAKVKDKQEEALIENKSSSAFPRKMLVYGTTKTFKLRLKQNAPIMGKRHECMELIQNEAKSRMGKGKTKSSNKIIKSSKGKSASNQSASLNENVETMIESITVDSARQEKLKETNLLGKVNDEQHRQSPRISEKPALSEESLMCIHIPSVDDNNVQNKNKNEHHSESNHSQSESDRHREKNESPGRSKHSSPKSSFSDSSGEGDEEVDYADDFNSLEPSDACSPDPVSSPEPSRAKTPRSPVHPGRCNSDSGSEGFQRKAVLPAPIKAPSSPQRALRGTHIIRPRTQASALSFSSDDGDRDRSASLQTTSSRRQMMEREGVERSSGADSFTSRGQRSKSAKNSGPVRGLSAESASSFEPQEVEELEDELGSLDFRKEYQHISELVANKLPGYTM